MHAPIRRGRPAAVPVSAARNGGREAQCGTVNSVIISKRLEASETEKRWLESSHPSLTPARGETAPRRFAWLLFAIRRGLNEGWRKDAV